MAKKAKAKKKSGEKEKGGSGEQEENAEGEGEKVSQKEAGQESGEEGGGSQAEGRGAEARTRADGGSSAGSGACPVSGALLDAADESRFRQWRRQRRRHDIAVDPADAAHGCRAGAAVA